MGANRYRVNRPAVIHETVDAETIIVNLDTGSYYDLNHVGAHILELIDLGATQDQIRTNMTRRYGIDPEAALSATEGLVTELLAEEIIIAMDGRENGDAVDEQQLTASSDSRPFVTPALGKHIDMQDLLLLDPVHEFEGEPPPEIKW